VRYLTEIYLLVECGTVEGTSLAARGLWPLRRLGKYRKCYQKSAVSSVLQQALEKHQVSPLLGLISDSAREERLCLYVTFILTYSMVQSPS